MVIALISDIHGNYPALQRVLEEIDKHGCKQILSLGDVSGYYCMVNECIEELRSRNVMNLLGNHDHYIIHNTLCPRSDTVNACISYQRSIITPKNWDYLRQSVAKFDDGYLSARHGGWLDPIDEYIKEFDFSIASGKAERIFASGHTHIQHMEKKGIWTYVNPGSVGQPRDGDSRAAFAIIEDDGHVTCCRVEYDIKKIANQMKKEGFSERTYECLHRGTRIGG